MSNESTISSGKKDATASAADQRAERIALAVRTLITELPADEQHRLLDDLRKKLHPISVPQAGDVLNAIVRLLPKRRQWTVEELKGDVRARGVSAEPKEIYNALGYLTRRRIVQRIGYGRYIVEGMPFHASDDFGGAPSPPEIDDL